MAMASIAIATSLEISNGSVLNERPSLRPTASVSKASRGLPSLARSRLSNAQSRSAWRSFERCSSRTLNPCVSWTGKRHAGIVAARHRWTIASPLRSR